MIPIASPDIATHAQDDVESVLESGMLADGAEVRAFEDEFADFCETTHGIATSNGTTAIEATLRAFGIGEGDRVLTTPFSFVATANTIRLTGAEPVFADIDPETYTLDPEAAADVAAEMDVDAILTVHLYGLPSEMDALVDLAAELDVPLIEDAAQAHGAAADGRRVGSIGDAACFSFYPTKNMTTGEGGMVTTARDDVASAIRSFINHGRRADGGGYEHVRLGTNYRLTNIAAAIGRSQLDRLPDFNEQRRANARRLTAALRDVPDVTPPVEPDGTRHVYHQYTIRTEQRDELAAHLDEHGVGTGIYYPTPIHKQPAYEDVSCSAPVAEWVAAEVLSLPVHPGVDADDVDHIIETIQIYEN
ncbi:Glutamine--scyllo-inositol transaminase [Halovivax asiaticus JCM 14624]|uniref:Glutamine--scyllo-inositol transaminase n=1 Tax=Halovivax asiaticus JCM 14624 TaxID=1227490 RepID=M0BL04_9EURY|nr:DegT/DnrJ/EryC1/StrS family aminotransferase [Halovivax asiaticus]ELZ11162.1 Glutamine--scyllo-inositol transaminase [Halovivax asiaticus JCM 14624]